MASKQTHAYLTSVLEHKRLVGFYLQCVITALVTRAVVHDFSKFSPEELSPYARMLPRFAKAEYGSEEYKACFDEVQPALAHHFTYNSHHPEFYSGGINDMDLLDVIEMVCDWVAACQRANGDTLRLDLQRERFEISDQLYAIICRTATRLIEEQGVSLRIVK